jgi:hypothetical protein
MPKIKNKEEHQIALLRQFHADARTMAEEAGIPECQFSAAMAFLCLAEMVINGHEACAMRLIARFFEQLADGEIRRETAHDDDLPF